MNRRLVLVSLATAFLLLFSGTEETRPRWIGIQAVHAAYVAEMPAAVPRNPFLSGRALLSEGRADEAAALLTLALAEQPHLAPYIRLSLAEAAHRQGDTAAALSFLREAAAPVERAHAFRALVRIAEISLASGRYADATAARAVIEKLVTGEERRRQRIARGVALAAGGESVAAVSLLEGVMAERGGAPVSATAATELMKITSVSPSRWVSLAGLYYEAGDFPRAASLYERALTRPEHRDDPRLLLQLGRSYERADEFRGAISVFRRVYDRHPAFSRDLVAYRIGLCHQRLGEDEEGEKWFALVMAANPRTSFADDILFRLASARDRREKRDEARSLYQRILDRHPRSEWADDAAWKIGFGLLEDGRSEDALRVFQNALRRFPRSDYAPVIAYWQARIHEKEGRREEALAGFTAILRSPAAPYYRARAAEGFSRLGGAYAAADVERARDRASGGDVLSALADLRAIRDASAGEVAEAARTAASELMLRVGEWRDLARFSTAVFDSAALLRDVAAESSDSVSLSLIQGLVAAGAWDEAAEEILTLRIDAGRRPEKRLAMVRVLAEAGQYRRAMLEVESLVRALGGPADVVAMPALAARLLYPRFYAPLVEESSRREGVDARLVLAVIREESRFQKDAVSGAGAHGLMQIMPATGAHVAKSMGIDDFRRESLRDPAVNIALGTRYLKDLLATYGGRKHLALAGYNAGPGNANRWLRQSADAEDDLFVERIAFRETRNYVKRVLGTYWVYCRLEGQPGVAF